MSELRGEAAFRDRFIGRVKSIAREQFNIVHPSGIKELKRGQRPRSIGSLVFGATAPEDGPVRHVALLHARFHDNPAVRDSYLRIYMPDAESTEVAVHKFRNVDLEYTDRGMWLNDPYLPEASLVISNDAQRTSALGSYDLRFGSCHKI